MQSVSHENEFDLHEDDPVGKHILRNMVSHKTRFDTEAKYNSEIVYGMGRLTVFVSFSFFFRNIASYNRDLKKFLKK